MPSTTAAIAWRTRRSYDKAIADYTEAIRLDPKYAMRSTTAASPGTTRTNSTRRSRTTTRRSGSTRRFADAFNNRGNAWSDKNEYDKAIADYNEAIRLDPKFAFGFYNRGNAWNDKGELDKAIADYTEAIRLDPEIRRAPINNRGVA